MRNGYLNVEQTHDGFRLTHSSQIFAYDEQRDIVASELSLTMLERRAPFNVKALSRIIEGWPHIRGDDLIAVLREAFDFYMTHIIEDEYVESSSYKAAFEFERDEFLRVRAALMAFASWCIGMAVGAEVKSSEVSSDDEAEHWRKECLEWAAPLLKANFVLGTIQGLSGVPKEQIDKMMIYFTNIPHEGKIISGDGYFAPLTLIGDLYLISPRAILTMTVERNLLYVSNKISRQRFDNIVSHHLEPSLLNRAAEIFSTVKGLRIEKNVHWTNGEIDLLVYDEMTDTALQMQAKAAIPPPGRSHD